MGNITNNNKIVLLKLGAVVTIITACLFFSCNSNKKSHTDIHSLFLAGNDLYAAGSVCDGSSTTDIPTLWKNGVAQEIGRQGNFNSATSVFVSGDDVYVTIREDYKASLWKNGERQTLGDCDANCVYVDNNQNVYVAGQLDDKPVLWKNSKVRTLGETGEAEYVLVKGDSVYVTGIFGNSFHGDAFLCIISNDGENDTTIDLGMSNANSIFITKTGDIYVAGGVASGAALWKNGEVEELWDCDNRSYKNNSGQSVAVNNDGKVVVAGIIFDSGLTCTAAIWVDGICHNVSDIMSYQAMSVVTDGEVFYIGGCSTDGKWSVWEYDGKSDFNLKQLKRVPAKK